MWEDYLRKEELVSIAKYDGSEESMKKFVTEFPDRFEIRVSDKGKKMLIIRDENVFIKAEPDTFITEDSCGRFYCYDGAFLDLLFRPLSEEMVDVDELAEAEYNAYCGENGSSDGQWDNLDDFEKERFYDRASRILDEFNVTRR